MSTASASQIRILLVDDHEMFLVGLRLILQREPGLVVVAEARNRQEALQASSVKPDIILLDLDLGVESGLDLLPDLLKATEGARVVALSGVADEDLHLRAVCGGAMGVVRKTEGPHLLVKAIHKVHVGEAWFNRTLMSSAMSQLQDRNSRNMDPEAVKVASLTARELEVITWVGQGLGNRQIGERLFISEKTVRHYLSAIFDKLEVANRMELMIYAYQHGLAKVPVRQISIPDPMHQEGY